MCTVLELNVKMSLSISRSRWEAKCETNRVSIKFPENDFVNKVKTPQRTD